MVLSAITPPPSDPTPIFEYFRGSYGTELLTAAVAHFDLFTSLCDHPQSLDDLASALGIDHRPAVVLITALRAMGLIDSREGKLFASKLAVDHLVPGAEFDVGNYIGLAASAPGVMQMVDLLKSNRPLDGGGSGTAFIYRDGFKSAMEEAETARHLTLALAGRAQNVAPALAKAVSLPEGGLILDVGGGTGIYSYAMLQKHRSTRAIIFDRPEVLSVADEMSRRYGVRDRVTMVPGDMFADPLPSGADVVLLSNILHDWDVPECQTLVKRCTDSMQSGGRLLIHDVFLNDDLDGPLSDRTLFGSVIHTDRGPRVQRSGVSAMAHHGRTRARPVVPTLVHCGVLEGAKA